MTESRPSLPKLVPTKDQAKKQVAEVSKPDETTRRRENWIAFLLFLAILALIMMTAGGGTPFIYGRF